MKDIPLNFFISYNKADRFWANGIGNWLDQAMYTTLAQSQDFVAGANFVSEMNEALTKAERMIAVISPDYFSAPFPESEWTAAFALDPTGKRRSLILVRVRECEIPPLLKTRVYIDLVGMDHIKAREHFLSEIKATLANIRKPGCPSDPHETRSTPRPHSDARIHQEIHGDRNVQAINIFANPPTIKNVIERREGSLTSGECHQVREWVSTLADGTIGLPRPVAYSKWWGHLKSAFRVAKYEDLPSTSMPDVEHWFRMQLGRQTRGLKNKAPEEWRRKRIAAIKTAMHEMGVTNEQYYPNVTQRLRMKKPFASLKDLTKRDLERVYTMALRDAGIR